MTRPAAFERGTQAYIEASRTRAEHLLAVASGLATPSDVIAAAGKPGGDPLLIIRLDQLLSTQPAWGARRTAHVLDRVRTLLNLPTESADLSFMTIGWLLDHRTRAHRLLIWLEATTDRGDAPPWPGFPFAPPPPQASL